MLPFLLNATASVKRIGIDDDDVISTSCFPVNCSVNILINQLVNFQLICFFFQGSIQQEQ